jgi:hypothetical protein
MLISLPCFNKQLSGLDGLVFCELRTSRARREEGGDSETEKEEEARHPTSWIYVFLWFNENE